MHQPWWALHSNRVEDGGCNHTCRDNAGPWALPVLKHVGPQAVLSASAGGAIGFHN